MLKENTGRHMLDSGGTSGRGWQRNANADFEKEPEVIIEYIDDLTDAIKKGEQYDDELYPTVSAHHYLTNFAGLSFDHFCDTFNATHASPAKDWDSDIYGVSVSGQEWLKNNNFEHLEDRQVNTCNDESLLDTVLQWNQVEHELTGEIYVLLQTHNGADVRGGYSDAKMFKCDGEDGHLHNPEVATVVAGKYLATYYSAYGTTLDSDDGVTFIPATLDEAKEYLDNLELTQNW